ncbi:MAG TPA: BamA/TamA family outer membrane protein [Puia sp.]|nr:BamA/TamA family outer membrane protein [Puia sp.]
MRFILCFFLIYISATGYGQVTQPADSLRSDSLRVRKFRETAPPSDTLHQYDFGDLLKAVIHPKKKGTVVHSRSGITVVPNISANPTIGEQLGIKAVAGRRLGNDPATLMSIGATSASITTKGIVYFYINHNVFTAGNRFNLQGNLIAARTVTPDFGLGIGSKFHGEDGADSVLADPTRHPYGIRSYYYNFREKVYKNIARDLFLGAGLTFEIRRQISQADTVSNATPSSVYNNRHGFPQTRYSSNGFLFNVEYITRDNPNRAYKGFYSDIGLRINSEWLGSTKNAVQVTTDLRKYISLSPVNPETVLALWNWGSYLVSGTIPYWELPGTARDGTFRSGRGYTAQYFKGTQFNDTEAELRFPILTNKFISGVVFGNLQTGNDEQGTRIFEVFQPGYGAGLRVLFNKVTRTNLALDYAFGRFGNKGFFLNLNEAF